MGNNMSKELKALQEENTKLKAQVVSLYGKLDRLGQEKAKLEKDKVNLCCRLDGLREEKAKLEDDKVLLKRRVQDLESAESAFITANHKQRRLNSKLNQVQKTISCGICLKPNSLSVEWICCQHLFCYKCIFDLLSRLSNLFHLKINVAGELEGVNNKQLVFCPTCNQHPVCWCDALETPLSRSHASLLIPSPAILSLSEWMDREEQKELRCPFCQTRQDSVLDALHHCHECLERYISCPFCGQEEVAPLVRDEYGYVSVSMSDFKLHIENACRGTWLCSLNWCNTVIPSHESAAHLMMHASGKSMYYYYSNSKVDN